MQSFAVALSRDATVGLPGTLEVVERRPKRKSWVVRVAVVIAALLVALAAIGSVIGPRPAAKEFHTGFPVSYASTITVGMPVVYEGGQIGEVQRSEVSGGEDVVWFTVDSDHRELQSSTSVTISYFAGRPCLEVVAQGETPAGAPNAGPA